MKSFVTVVFSAVVLVSLCTAQSDSRTYDEVQAKLHLVSDQKLVNCLKLEPKTCPLEDRDWDLNMIESELGDRKHPDLLIAAYEKSDDGDQRHNLVKALYQIDDDPKALAFMRSIAFEHLGNGMDNEGTFFPLDYLADHCDHRALARLNRHVNFKHYTPMGCFYWAQTVRSLGRCNYLAAAPNLVRSLDAACLNITGAAEEGLHKFFPGACQDMHSIEEEQRCYKRLLKDQPKQKDQ